MPTSDYKVIFKVRDSKTGLFSKGGTVPKWSKLGKVWKTPGHLSSHLSAVADWNKHCDGAIQRRGADAAKWRLDQFKKVDTSTWEIVHYRTEEVARCTVEEYRIGRQILREKRDAS